MLTTSSPILGRKAPPTLKILTFLVKNLKLLSHPILPPRELKNIPGQVFKEKEYKMHKKLKFYFIMATNGNTPSNYSFKSYIKRLECADENHYYLPHQTLTEV